MKISRTWAMPSSTTFSIPPIARLIERYVPNEGVVTVDPFALNHNATFTNDLNPDTNAEYHMDALDFLKKLNAEGIKANVVYFDPPYSIRQCVESYKGVGRPVTQRDTQVFNRWTEHKMEVAKLLAPNGIVISCGWNSQGMNKKNGFSIEEVLLVCHGGAHNDTIVTVDRLTVEEVA